MEAEEGAPGFGQSCRLWSGGWGFQLVEDCEHAFVQQLGEDVIHLELSRRVEDLMRLMMLGGSDNF
ncbi:hypothetical protein ACWGE0_14275 [Lentzea sp. NPDC054927]